MAVKVLVISPHPDDETLGAGGTLLRHIANGDEVYWCIVTHAFADSPQCFRENRLAIINKVGKAYCFAGCFSLDFPAGALDTVPERQIIDSLASVILESEPDTVYCVSDADVNTDHDTVYRCAMSALKPAYAPFVREVLLYEVPSSTNWAFPEKAGKFSPNTYIDISCYLEKKLEIINLFGREIKPFPHARSIEAIKSLAIYRGSTVNITYAEAFIQVRRIVGG